MKRAFGIAIAIAIAIALILTLAGCGKLPQKDLAGNNWDDSWQEVGILLGVETPQGFKLDSASEALATRGVSFASWGQGEPEVSKNDKGQETRIYDVQFFVLLQRFKNDAAAQDAVGQWRDVEAENYSLTPLPDVSFNGQPFVRFALEPVGEGDFQEGELALAVCGNSAVSIELMARNELSDGELDALMEAFLAGVHFRDFSDAE